VIDEAAKRGHAVHHPARLAERRDEEAHTFFERDVHVALHALEIESRRLLDQHVHADRLGREALDHTETVAQEPAVHVLHRERLHDADAPGMGHGGDELRVRAR
jgi:hypothetical protein